MAGDPNEEGSALSTVVGGASLVFGGRIVKLLLLAGTEILMARLLGATGYGEVVIGVMIISVGAMFAKLGLAGGVTRKIPYYEDEPAKGRGVVHAAVAFTSLASLVIAALIAWFAPVVASRIFDAPELTPVVRIAAVGVPFGAFTGLGLAIAKSSRDAKPHVVVNQLLKPVAKFAFISILVFVGLGAMGAMAGTVAASAVAMIVAMYLATKSINFDLRGRATRMYGEMLTFSVPLMFASGVQFLIGNTDTFLLGAYLTSSAVGTYNVAFQLQQIGMVFFYPATFLLPPILTRLQKKGQTRELRRTYQVVTKWMTLATIPVFTLVLLFPGFVISWTFGAQYADATLPVRILFVPIIVTVLLGANGKSLVSLGHNRINFYVNAGVAVLNVGLNLYLIPRIGITGAAIASATAFICRDVAYTIALYRWHGVHPFSRALIRPLALTTGLIGVTYPLFVSAFPITLLSITALGVVAVVVYLPLLIWGGAIESADVELFEELEESTGVQIGAVRRFVKVLA